MDAKLVKSKALDRKSRPQGAADQQPCPQVKSLRRSKEKNKPDSPSPSPAPDSILNAKAAISRRINKPDLPSPTPDSILNDKAAISSRRKKTERVTRKTPPDRSANDNKNDSHPSVTWKHDGGSRVLEQDDPSQDASKKIVVDVERGGDQAGTLPGSYAVHLFDDDDDAVDMQSGHDSADQLIFEAELVDTRAEEQQREKERVRIRNEAFQELSANAAKAEVVDDSLERRKRRKLVVMLILVASAAIIAAVVVGVVMKTKDTDVPIPTKEDTIKSEFGDDILDDTSSAPYRAASWMTENDTTWDPPLTTEYERMRFRQRYIMCILAFATDIDHWTNGARWLEPISECKWSGVSCDKFDRLMGLSLGKFVCSGTFSRCGRLSQYHYAGYFYF